MKELPRGPQGFKEDGTPGATLSIGGTFVCDVKSLRSEKTDKHGNTMVWDIVTGHRYWIPVHEKN